MIWPFKRCNTRQEIVNTYKKHPSVKDYSDDELFQDLENAEKLPSEIVACVCAEVLRRAKGKSNE